MILVFGAILMNMKLRLTQGDTVAGTHFANKYEMGIGGQAAIQALGAAKTGESVSLVGQIGDDHYGKNVLLRLRQGGVTTSGVARHHELTTGSILELGEKSKQTMIALGASTEASHDQIPQSSFRDGGVLLIQDDLPIKQNRHLLPKAKENGCKTVLSCARRKDIEEYDLNLLNYVITTEDNAHIIQHVKSKTPNKLIIVTKGGGCLARREDGKKIELAPADVKGVKEVDPNCATDAFIGVFAAGIYTRMSLRQALRRAGIAYALTAGKKGGYRSLPYPDDIRDAVVNTDVI